MNSVSRIKGLRFGTRASEIDKAPRRIKIFVDRPNLGFDDADNLEPAQELELNQDQAKGARPSEFPRATFPDF
jgi:PITH domain